MSIEWRQAPPRVVADDELPAQPARARIKVLHVVTKLMAGAGGNTLLSATGMDRDRYEVWVVGSEEGPLWELAEQAGVKTVKLPNFHREVSPADDLRVFLRLVRLIRKQRFTVVHTHNAKGGFLGRLAALVSRTPVIVYTLHGRDPWWRISDEATFGDDMGRAERWAYLVLERLLRPATDAFVAVAPQIARDAVESAVASPGKVAVVPSAVSLDKIPTGADASARRELGIADGVPLIGTVGRIDYQKAPLDFVRMARHVADVRPDARFVWIGEGALEREAIAEASHLGVDVTFTGYRADAPTLASTFDVYVVSSLYEGVGRSLTEAMATARPVVATAVDGILDVVVPGATGLLAPPRDPRALADGVLWMLRHPNDAERMGRQGQGFVRSLFAQSFMCGGLDRVYSKQLGLRPVDAVPPALADTTTTRLVSLGSGSPARSPDSTAVAHG